MFFSGLCTFIVDMIRAFSSQTSFGSHFDVNQLSPSETRMNKELSHLKKKNIVTFEIVIIIKH